MKKFQNWRLIILAIIAMFLTACSGSEVDDELTNQAPSANAGSDQSVELNSNVTVDASSSTDADGDMLTFSWSISSMPSSSQAQLGDSTQASTSLIVDAVGDFELTVTVSDGNASSTDTLVITVSDSNAVTNAAPSAAAGSDQTIVLGETASLDASASSDVDGDTLTYSWAISTAPSNSSAEITNNDNVSASFTPDVAGSYELTVTVSDGLDSDADSLTITAEAINNAPEADAGEDLTVNIDDTVTLDASNSTDADGDELSYVWALSISPEGSSAEIINATQINATFAPDVAGSYQFTLTVNDGELEGTDTLTIIAEELVIENVAPIADAGEDQTANAGDAITLDASGSSDSDGDTLTYSWELTSYPNGNESEVSDADNVTATFMSDISGYYVFELTVSDGEESDSDTVTVTIGEVTGSNNTPIADAGEDQDVEVDALVTLDASDSSDLDSDTLSYEWVILEAPEGSEVMLSNANSVSSTFTPDVAGAFRLRVRVSDGISTSGDNVRVTATEVTSNIDHFIINNSDTSDYIYDVLEDVQVAEYRTLNNKEYMYVEATGIPKYDVTMTQDMIDELNERPNASDDFRGPNRDTTSASAGDLITFGADLRYNSSSLNCEDTGGDGYWPPGPACPIGQDKQNYFPADPEVTSSECETSLGEVGTMVNGTSLYNWGDGGSEGDGVWWTLAPKAEFFDVDICGGHANQDGDYHHHFYTSCLADLLGDDGSAHSPIYAFAADGYPVYGPYESNETLAISGWVTRDYGAPTSEGGCNTEGERTCTLVNNLNVSEGVETAEQGPDIGSTYTSQSGNAFSTDDGFFYEDYYFAGLEATGAQLDQHNGHDNGDERGYHYHITLELDEDGDLIPSFPFTVGPNFKGDLPENTFAGCDGSTMTGPR